MLVSLRPRAMFLVVLSCAVLHSQPGGVATVYSSIAGPLFCAPMAGYPAPPLCTVPGEVPIGSFAAPSKGGTYKDQNFGATVTVMTGPGFSTHPYSSPTSLSATGKYARFTVDEYFSTIASVSDAIPVRQMFRRDRSWSSGESVWDTKRDDTFYYFSNYWNGSRHIQDRLMRFNILTGEETLIRDFSAPPFRFQYVSRGGTGDMSSDGWLQFLADDKYVCVVQVSNGLIYCASYLNAGGLGWSFVDFVSISKGPDPVTRKYHLIVQGQPANAFFEFDPMKGLITFKFRGPEITGNGNGVCETGETCLGQAHSDTFQDSGGKQYLLRAHQTQTPCALYLSSFDLSAGSNMLKPVAQGGGRKDIALLAKCGSLKWPDLHIGCARRTPNCAVTIENRPVLNPPVIRDGAPYNGEIWVMRDNGTEIRRVAMHRSVIQAYYSQPRAGISDDGRLVLWDTNFGLPNSSRVVVANTGIR